MEGWSCLRAANASNRPVLLRFASELTANSQQDHNKAWSLNAYGCTKCYQYPPPLWDLTCVNDTVLLSISSIQRTCFLHTLQREASVRGLFFNFDECAYLRHDSEEPIFFFPHRDSPWDCACCMGNSPLDNAVSIFDAVKYFGFFLGSCSNNIQKLTCRVAPAMSASKLFRILLGHTAFPFSWVLTVRRPIMRSLVLFMRWRGLNSRSQITKLNQVHFKSITRHL